MLQRAADDGYATEDGEVTEGMASIGIVVRDHLGWPAAGIAVTFPVGNLRPEDWPEVASVMNRTAAELGRRIGARSDVRD
jgi:DNA-binding IclR family transcriptional regulator